VLFVCLTLFVMAVNDWDAMGIVSQESALCRSGLGHAFVFLGSQLVFSPAPIPNLSITQTWLCITLALGLRLLTIPFPRRNDQFLARIA